MTAADLATVLYLDDLPSLASHPDVTVVWSDTLELGECSACCDRTDCDPKSASLRVLYDQWNHTDFATDACDAEHADEELAWLLRPRPEVHGQPRNIRLLVPSKLAGLPVLPSGPLLSPAQIPPGSVVASEDDEVFAQVEALLRYVQTLPDPGGVEEFRRKVVAAVASLGLARINQLGRAAS